MMIIQSYCLFNNQYILTYMRQYRSREHAEVPFKREAITHELDEHTNRIKELLRADLNLLQEENNVLKTKLKKVPELEERIEIILRHNSELLGQNQKISKMLHQKKAEFQLLKNKYEAQASQKYGVTASLQFQKKKLLNELEHLTNQLKDLESIKNTQIADLRSQSQLQIQNLKRINAQNSESYQVEIRKLKQILERKEYQLVDIQSKLKRLNNDSEYELLRVKQEKQKLKDELSNIQKDRKRDYESLRVKLQASYIEEIQEIKRNHSNNINFLQMDNLKCRQDIQNKKLELEQLNTKNNKQKQQYEQTLMILRRQNDVIREKLIISQKSNEGELQNFKIKINKLHQVEIQELNRTNERHSEWMKDQISKLELILIKKNQEIQEQIRQKSLTRQNYDSEQGRLKDQLQSLNYKIKDLQMNLKRVTESSEQKIRDKQSHISYLQKINAEQLQSTERQLESLRNIIEKQKLNIESQRNIHRQKEQRLKQQMNNISEELSQVKGNYKKLKEQSKKIIDDLKFQIDTAAQLNKNKLQSKESTQNYFKKQIEFLKQNIISREKENTSLTERMKRIEEVLKKFQRENDDLKARLIKKDQKTNQLLVEQKKRLESVHEQAMESLKVDNQSAIKFQKNKINDLNERMAKKQKQLEDLLAMYKKMREEFEAFTLQQAKTKQLTIKHPGATADLMATKNVFDVFLKSKVIELCKVDKQNYFED